MLQHCMVLLRRELTSKKVNGIIFIVCSEKHEGNSRTDDFIRLSFESESGRLQPDFQKGFNATSKCKDVEGFSTL